MHAYMNKEKSYIMKEKILSLKIYQRRKNKYQRERIFYMLRLKLEVKIFYTSSYILKCILILAHYLVKNSSSNIY